jgi:hypothetical protein
MIHTNVKVRMGLIVALIMLSLASVSGAQTSTAAATPVTASSGRPSSFQIQQNYFTIQLAGINRQLQQVQRCIANAVNPQILRDPEGNINRVPQVDAITCGYQLKLLQRQLASLARQQAKLAQDASAQSGFLEVTQRQAQLQQLIKAISGQRSAASRIIR